ncbi:MAG: hypothetical protein U0354_03475 [Candidatus Sericytochromatia bacterium]
MKILKKLTSLVSISLISLFSTISYANTSEYIIINLNKPLDTKYIKIINLLTNTELKEKNSDLKYTFYIKDKNQLESYSDLLSMIPEVKNTEPKLNSSLISKKAGDYVDGVILVKYKEGTNKAQINKIDSKYKTKSVLFSPSLNLYKINLPENISIEEAVKIFSKLPEVQYAEPDMVMTILKNKKFKINFKDELSKKLFENIYDLKCNILANNSCEIKLDKKYNSEQVIKSLKLSPYIIDVKQVN